MLIHILGLIVFIGIAFLFSDNKSKINWRIVNWGVASQFLFAFLILRTPFGEGFMNSVNAVMNVIISASNQGASFLFGQLTLNSHIGAQIAFQVLPLIIFVSSLMSLLYFLNVIPYFVRGLSRLMKITMRISGVEALASSLLVFFGIESLTSVKPFIDKLSRSQLFTLMVGYMSTIAGSVMAAYVSFGANAGHLFAASVMSAPAAIALSKIMVPETRSEDPTQVDIVSAPLHSFDGPIDAVSTGAVEGSRLALNIAALLIAFVGIIALINYPLSLVSFSMEEGLGILLRPAAFLMGIPWEETAAVGQLLGVKVIFTEFLSYAQLASVSGNLSSKSIIITTYALCGFTSFLSLGIFIGAISALSKTQRGVAIKLGMKALLAALLAGFMTANIAGLLL